MSHPHREQPLRETHFNNAGIDDPVTDQDDCRQSVQTERSTGRIVGIDVARGLAILGMMAVHTLDPGPFPWVEWMPDNWDQTVRGRSAILFAVIAGISIAILSGRNRPYTGVPLLQARMRILVRAVVIFGWGGVLWAIPDQPLAIILEFYAVTFALALPFLSVPPRVLLPLTGVLAIVLPAVMFVLQNLNARGELGDPAIIVRMMITGTYPAMTWIVYVLLGLAVGRLDLESTSVRIRLFLAGWALALAGILGARWAAQTWPPPEYGSDNVVGRFDLRRMATTEAHTETWFEVVGSCGVALVIVVACIVIAPRARVLVYPLAATGAMALSVYSIHAISMPWIWDHLDLDNQYQIYLWTVAITLVASTLWRLIVGQGPLEWVLSGLSWRAARI